MEELIEDLKTKIEKAQTLKENLVKMGVTELSISNFDSFISSNEKVLVGFANLDCDACDAIMPIIGEILEETGVKLGRVEAKQTGAQPLFSMWRPDIPGIFVFQNGKMIERIGQAITKETILKALEN